MSNPVWSTPMQKYLKMKDQIDRSIEKYEWMKNKETKTAIKTITDIKRREDELKELEKNKDQIVLSKTCIKHLDQWIAKNYYWREKMLNVAHIEKWTECEREAIEIVLNKALGTDYRKYKWDKLENEYMTWHIDTHDGKQMTIDTKVCATMDSFPILREELDKAYWRQWQQYMILMSERYWRDYNVHQVIKVLVNSPARLIENELWREFNSLSRKYNWDELLFQDIFENKAQKIVLNHVFDKQRRVRSNWLDISLTDEQVIPYEKRISIHEFKKDPEAEEMIIKRVMECREFLSQHWY